MSRDRVTITLDDALLSAVDGTIDGSAVRNRSHAIEHLIRQGLHLHELTHVVLVAGTATTTPLLPQLTDRLKETSVTHCMIVSDPVDPNWANDTVAALAQLAPKLQTRILPGDFGSAAALTLAAQKLTTPFLIVEIAAHTALPSSFLRVYSSHHRTDCVVTHLLATHDGSTFQPTGVSVASPDLISEVPAGHSQLSDVFPLLAKAGRVGAYVD